MIINLKEEKFPLQYYWIISLMFPELGKKMKNKTKNQTIMEFDLKCEEIIQQLLQVFRQIFLLQVGIL